MGTSRNTKNRKNDHIQINLDESVYGTDVSTGFEHYRLVHAALPELALHDIDPRVSFLGRDLASPILISSMTGGVQQGWEITRRLASAAQSLRCAIAVGSQRVAIEDPARARYFQIRDVAPDVLLLANLGAVQLNYGFGIDECRRAVEMINADALILHLNPLQEALQIEGNHDFSDLLLKIDRVASALDVPIVVKEVGFGISPHAARRLVEAGVTAIDVSGAGGTSWSAVEQHRADSPLYQRLAETFVDWGIPTAIGLRLVRQELPEASLIASGGLRNGIDAAKAIAMGANLVGFAGPLLRAAASSEESAFATLAAIVEELRLAMFCSGARDLSALSTIEMLDLRDGSRSLGPQAGSDIQAQLSRSENRKMSSFQPERAGETGPDTIDLMQRVGHKNGHG